MYFERNNDLEKYKLYLSFFTDLSNNKANSEKYTDFLNQIITETHQLSKDEIGYSNISKEIFDIVSLLNLTVEDDDGAKASKTTTKTTGTQIKNNDLDL